MRVLRTAALPVWECPMIICNHRLFSSVLKRRLITVASLLLFRETIFADLDVYTPSLSRTREESSLRFFKTFVADASRF